MTKPNILLITSDQQHWNTIGAFNSEICTPTLDRLVREGMVFTRAYCANPTCTPSRASILTGKYASQHGAWALGTKLPESEWTIGSTLMQAGYRTALIGKGHLQHSSDSEEYPSLERYSLRNNQEFWKNPRDTFYGFQEWELNTTHTVSPTTGMSYGVWLKEKCSNWRDYFWPPLGIRDKSISHTWDIPEELHYNTWITEKSNSFLEECSKRNENFFLWASFPDPHPGYFVPEPWASMYDPDKLTLPEMVENEHLKNPPHFQLCMNEKVDVTPYQETGFCGHIKSHQQSSKSKREDLAVYYGMISFMDKYIGKILDKIDKLKLLENTIVVFTTDHGHLLGHHGFINKGPFHYEDLIKIPFIVRYPSVVAASRKTDALFSLVDLAPTLLQCARLPIPRSVTGIDQHELWFGKKEKIRDHVICENRYEPTTIHLKTYVSERYKITVYYNKEYGELFDLQNDPEEINNLWDNAEFSELKTRLLLKYIWAELGKEPMWMPKLYYC